MYFCKPNTVTRISYNTYDRLHFVHHFFSWTTLPMNFRVVPVKTFYNSCFARSFCALLLFYNIFFNTLQSYPTVEATAWSSCCNHLLEMKYKYPTEIIYELCDFQMVLLVYNVPSMNFFHDKKYSIQITISAQWEKNVTMSMVNASIWSLPGNISS